MPGKDELVCRQHDAGLSFFIGLVSETLGAEGRDNSCCLLFSVRWRTY